MKGRAMGRGGGLQLIVQAGLGAGGRVALLRPGLSAIVVKELKWDSHPPPPVFLRYLGRANPVFLAP